MHFALRKKQQHSQKQELFVTSIKASQVNLLITINVFCIAQKATAQPKIGTFCHQHKSKSSQVTDHQ
jgi:hypothetical protein